MAADPAASPELKACGATWIEEIDRRSRPEYFTFKIAVNALVTTKAKNGPTSCIIEFLGVPAPVTDLNAAAQTDGGVSVNGQVTWVQDPGGPLGDE